MKPNIECKLTLHTLATAKMDFPYAVETIPSILSSIMHQDIRILFDELMEIPLAHVSDETLFMEENLYYEQAVKAAFKLFNEIQNKIPKFQHLIHSYDVVNVTERHHNSNEIIINMVRKF